MQLPKTITDALDQLDDAAAKWRDGKAGAGDYLAARRKVEGAIKIALVSVVLAPNAVGMFLHGELPLPFFPDTPTPRDLARALFALVEREPPVERMDRYTCHAGITAKETCGRCGPVIRALTLIDKVPPEWLR